MEDRGRGLTESYFYCMGRKESRVTCTFQQRRLIMATVEQLVKWLCMSKECRGWKVFVASILSHNPRILPVCPDCGHSAVDAYDG